jgi:hypothetical protein
MKDPMMSVEAGPADMELHRQLHESEAEFLSIAMKTTHLAYAPRIIFDRRQVQLARFVGTASSESESRSRISGTNETKRSVLLMILQCPSAKETV